MAVVAAVVAKSMAVVATVQQVGISSSLGLSLGLPLSVVGQSMAIVAKSGIAKVSKSVVAKTVASVEEIGVSLCLGFRLSGSDGRESENYEQFHVECRMSRSKLCSPCTL